jgi:hypothetical protein
MRKNLTNGGFLVFGIFIFLMNLRLLAQQETAVFPVSKYSTVVRVIGTTTNENGDEIQYEKKIVEITTISDGIRCRIRMDQELYVSYEFNDEQLLQFSANLGKRLVEAEIGDSTKSREVALSIVPAEFESANNYLNVKICIRFPQNYVAWSYIPEQWKKKQGKWQIVRFADGWSRFF